MTTKEKILLKALDLFSVKGFDPVSVRDIARAVGIKESSLYNHFKNKQDIFESIVAEYASRNEAFFHQMQLTDEDRKFKVDERTVQMYKNMTPEQFVAMSTRVFDHYFSDEISVKLRRMLTIEQYRNPGTALIFREISFDAALDYQSRLFQAMMEAGLFKGTDPYILALEFFAPIFLIFYKFGNDGESLKSARDLFIRHIRHFIDFYIK